MYRHSESTGAQSENPKNSPTYYIVSGGFDPIHEGHIEMIKAGAAASDGVILLLNSDAWLCRKKGKNFMNYNTRRVICENLKGVIDVLAFNDDDNSASDGIRRAREKYADCNLVFANGGDRTKDNIPERKSGLWRRRRKQSQFLLLDFG